MKLIVLIYKFEFNLNNSVFTEHSYGKKRSRKKYKKQSEAF